MSAPATPIKNQHVYAAERIVARHYYLAMLERGYTSCEDLIARIGQYGPSEYLNDFGLARLHTLQQIVAEHLAAQVFAGTAAGQSTVMGSAPASIADDSARSAEVST